MRFTLLSLASLLAAGCTFAPGAPWGTLDVALQVRFDPSARAAGPRLETTTGFLIELDEVALDIEAVEVFFEDEAITVAFDEANPPEGYGGCHDGHCHHDDGRLVSYADIAREISGEAPAESSGLSIEVDQPVVLDEEGVAVALDCGDCALPATTVHEAHLELSGVHLRGRAFAEDAPNSPIDIVIDFDHPLAAHVELDEEIGPWSPPTLGVALDFALPVGILDLDWSEPDPELWEALFADDETSLTAVVDRGQ